MSASRDVIIGIDSGTSVVKAVAFDFKGRQIGMASVRNHYDTGAGGAATQSMQRTWADCAAALVKLGASVDNLSERTAAIGVTGQGDGTWLVGDGDAPVCDAWLWLDARAAPTVTQLTAHSDERARFLSTGTGLNTCQQGSQLAHMLRHSPDVLDHAETAMHCKDWLFLNLTGIRATDPSEASFTFGDFRSRQYNDTVIEALGLTKQRHLLPDILDGTQHTFPLTQQAATQTGLRAGTPVSLGYVDMVMTALGAGVYTGDAGSACSTIGSTGVHMQAVTSDNVHLNDEGTGYAICLPVPGIVTQVQTNMAATLNIDWALSLAADLLDDLGVAKQVPLMDQLDRWITGATPATLLYHPYISEAGERGPFVNADARASFLGLSTQHRFGDIVRAVVEGLAMATRDCYDAMGAKPTQLRLTGGAARSPALRHILASALNTPVRVSTREEAGAAGCATMAAVAIGAYADMDSCIADWTKPLLGGLEPADPDLAALYDRHFNTYRATRQTLPPIWDRLAAGRHHNGALP